MIFPWQREVVEARIVIVKEVLRLEKHLRGITAAIEKVVVFSKSKQLPPQIEAMVPRANTRFGKKQSSDDQVDINNSLNSSSLYRRITAFREDPSRLAPQKPGGDPVPEWASPLFEVFKEREEISMKAAVRDLNSRGIKCNYQSTRAFIRRMAEEIEQLTDLDDLSSACRTVVGQDHHKED